MKRNSFLKTKKKKKQNPKRIKKHTYTHARTHVFSINYSYNILMVYCTRRKVPNLAISVKMSMGGCVFTLLRNTFFLHSLSLSLSYFFCFLQYILLSYSINIFSLLSLSVMPSYPTYFSLTTYQAERVDGEQIISLKSHNIAKTLVTQETSARKRETE